MMKFNNLCKLLAVMAVATTLELFSLAKPADATEVNFIALTSDNSIARYNSNSGKFKKAIEVKGVDGNLQGIDFRPANGLLYGVTDTNKIYTIDPNTGAATFVSTLSTSFNGGVQSGVDFNPAADRLRVNGSNDQNLRINVDTGAVTVDGTLAYANGDPNFGVDPNVTAAAYINSVAGATSTALYNIDYAQDVLVLQNPPNSGTLTTVGHLGVNFASVGGFDIFTDANGVNYAYALSGSTLYSIDLNTGAATKLENVIKEGREEGFIGLAVTSAKMDDKDDNKSDRN